ncbi:MAG: bifunctional demethylmenaquinone methyltransferase/2-methoxy-6-polyprenyl-1,4-benzoquinol methylase UbiE [Ignavibacteria bacterium]|nr:bifunctional demethylmenaquinone methyltransferase/2-methoxy-6-polyprenyl-1,4-benzoquinol methylase UbiE [Ignavibacteria bacterium]
MQSDTINLFDSIATKYDLINDLLSFGIHRFWLKKAVAKVPLKDYYSILDLATGTGNFAFEFLKANPKINVIGIDLSENMLNIARKKSKKLQLEARFILGSATEIPFPDDTFDIVSISYGIRNVNDVDKCLLEIHRVLKKDGNFVIVEFGKPQGWFRSIYNAYQRIFVQNFGGLLSKNFYAYNYLVQTSNSFPSGNDFVNKINQTNLFTFVRFYSLTFGIAYIYTGKAKK